MALEQKVTREREGDWFRVISYGVLREWREEGRGGQGRLKGVVGKIRVLRFGGKEGMNWVLRGSKTSSETDGGRFSRMQLDPPRKVVSWGGKESIPVIVGLKCKVVREGGRELIFVCMEVVNFPNSDKTRSVRREGGRGGVT